MDDPATRWFSIDTGEPCEALSSSHCKPFGQVRQQGSAPSAAGALHANAGSPPLPRQQQGRHGCSALNTACWHPCPCSQLPALVLIPSGWRTLLNVQRATSSSRTTAHSPPNWLSTTNFLTTWHQDSALAQPTKGPTGAFGRGSPWLPAKPAARRWPKCISTPFGTGHLPPTQATVLWTGRTRQMRKQDTETCKQATGAERKMPPPANRFNGWVRRGGEGVGACTLLRMLPVTARLLDSDKWHLHVTAALLCCTPVSFQQKPVAICH